MRSDRGAAQSSIEEITGLLPDVGSPEPSVQLNENCVLVSGESLVASPFLSLREAADWLCVSRSTLKRLVAKGELSTIRVGKRQKISASCLTAYVTRDVLLPETITDTCEYDCKDDLRYL
jgi:excisionase family DNA binding protein